jgi:thiol-disulfide isomerase/thioredoxin
MAAQPVHSFGQESANQLGSPYNGLISHSQQSVDAGWVPDARQSETKPWNRTNTNTESCPVKLEAETGYQQSLRRAYKGKLDRRDIYSLIAPEKRNEEASKITGQEKVDFTPEHIKRQDNEQKNYVVMISADWCIWCKRMYPMMKELREKGYIVYIFETNREEFKDYAALYKVGSYPTFIVYDKAKEVDRTTGKTTEEWFKKRLKTRKEQEADVKPEPSDTPYDGL